MSTKPIKDYLIKHIFIEKNVVTYRSLSRHFGIKVSEAKQELALYHAKAHEESQTCHATYIISGECNIVPVSVAKRGKGCALDFSQQSTDTDMSMDTDGSLMGLTQTQDEHSESDDDYEADEDYEDVPVIKVTVVNENDLEDAQAKYRRVTSVHVYSLSPSPVIDAELLCSQTKSVREMDASQGPEYAQKIGKISAPNVVVHRTAAQKESDKNKPKPKPPVAGPSRVRQAPEKKPAPPAPQDVEMKDSASTVAAPSAKKTKPAEKQAPVKPKQAGRLQFQPKQPQAEVKAEDNAAADKRKGFFSAKPAKKPTTVKEEDKDDDKLLEAPVGKPKRGLKRKSVVPSDESGSEDETPQPKQSTSKSRSKKETAPTNLRVKKGALISDDDIEEEVKPKAKVVPKRKQEAAEKARLAEEKEARELMDLDDDVVERVARKPPSKAVSPKRKREEDGDGSPVAMKEAPEKVKQEPDDVEMEDAITRPKPKKKREKKVVPLGSNGLKKKRVTKSRTVMDAKGYMGTEDYTDWESVDEEEAEEPKVKATTKTRAKALTAREKPPADDDSALSIAGSVASKQEAPVPKAKAEAPKKVAAPKPSKPKPAGNATVKGKQQSIGNFFGAKPAKK